MKKAHILSWSLLPISLLLVSCGQDTPTTISTSDDPSFMRTLAAGGPTNIDAFDMNDRFSDSGAKGSGTARVKDGQLTLTIHARDLEADHPYEVHVIVGPEGREELVDDLADLIGVHIFSVTSDKNGKFEFKMDFDLGLDPGQYRLDYLVLHDLEAHAHEGKDEFPDFLVLACAPASFVTI